MKLDIRSLIEETFSNPQSAAQRLLTLQLPIEISGLALIGSIAASVMVTFILNGLQPIEIAPGMPLVGPLALAATVSVLTFLLVGGVTVAGKLFQGQGSLADAAVLIAWTQVMRLLLQLVQLVLASVSLILAGMFGLVVTIIMLWVLVNFINVLHRLNNMGQAIVVFLLAVVGIILSLGFLAIFFGFTPTQTL